MSVTLLPLITYTFVGSITPGPNNILLATSGVNFGLRRTLPHAMGVYLGFLAILSIACFGLGQVFSHVPLLQPVLKYAGCAYLLYLAWRTASAGKITSDKLKKPFSFF